MDLIQMPSREATPSPAPDPPGPGLGEYIRIAWRYRWVLLAAAVVSGAVLFSQSVSGPRVFESAVIFTSAQSKIGETAETPVSSVSGFRPLVESRSNAQAVIADLGLDKPPDSMLPTEFLEKVLTVEEIRGTNLMRVTAVFRDPVISARIANRVAERAVELSQAISANEALQARDLIKTQLDSARLRFDHADAQMRAFRGTAQIEALQGDADSALDERSGLLDLLVRIQSEKAKLARLEEELKNRPPLTAVKKTIDSEPALTEAARQKAEPGRNLLGVELSSETVNEVYQQIDAEAAKTRANLAGLEKQKKELVDVRKLDSAALPQLTKLYEREASFARLKVERDLAEKIYTDVAARYEVARLQVAARSGQLQILDRATPPDRPVSRHVVRNTVVGAVAGLCLALAAILLWEGVVRPALASSRVR